MSLSIEKPLIPSVPRRLADWPQRLAAFFADAQTKEFAYGTFDCCVFASNAVYAMTGIDMMHNFRGRYHDPDDIAALLAQENAPHLIALIRRVLHQNQLRLVAQGFAQRGDLALTRDGVMGVVALDNRHITVLHPILGTHHVPLSFGNSFWQVI